MLFGRDVCLSGQCIFNVKMRYALLECVFTLSGLCGLFVCTLLVDRDVCLSRLCMFLPCLVYVGCLSGLCCFRVVLFCLDCCLSGLFVWPLFFPSVDFFIWSV